MKTEVDSTFIASSPTPTPVPGASIRVNVPAGETRCVKVRFSASVACAFWAGLDGCKIRVRSSLGPTFDPGSVIFQQESAAVSAHSFEWSRELGPGKHDVLVEASTTHADTKFTFAQWAMDVEVSE